MYEFFCGWKRKLGVVTLLMACGVTSFWMRSYAFDDIVEFQSGPQTTELFGSVGQSIVWVKRDEKGPIQASPLPNWESAPSSYEARADDHVDWNWRWSGFGSGIVREEFSEGDRISVCKLPYWSIVLSLTLLSASFLLSTPLQAQKQAAPPVIDSKQLESGVDKL